MKQWNGLLKKEWSAMKGNFYAIIALSIFFTILIPVGNHLLGWGLDMMELSISTSVFWMAVSMLIPPIIFLISLGREMGRPDVWLHSTVSIFKLFGTKALFGEFVGVASMLIPLIVIVIQSKLVGFQSDFSFTLIIVLFLMFFMLSLLLLCMGLFFGVLYQLIRPVMKGFAVPFVAILFFFFTWIVERITATAVYKNIVSMGPIIGTEEGGFNSFKGNSYIEMNAMTFHGGSILMNLLFAALLFVTAVVLFEKKVRL